MKTKMQKLFHKVIKSKNTKFDDIITLAYNYNYMYNAYLILNRKENLSLAEDFVLHCLQLIKNKELDRKVILLAMKAKGNLAFIYVMQRKIEKAIGIYNKTVLLYFNYLEKASEDYEHNSPLDFEDIIKKSSTQLNGYEKIRRLYLFISDTLIDFYTSLGPTHHLKLILCSYSRLCCDLRNVQTVEEAVQWVTKTMEFCYLLIKYKRFQEVKINITAAMLRLKEEIYSSVKYNNIKKQGFSSEVTELDRQCVAAFDLINLHHIRYNVAFLRRSMERLLQLKTEKIDEDSETENSAIKCPTNSKKQTFKLLFAKEDSDNCYHFMSIKYVINYNDAYKMFTDVLKMFHGLKPRLHPDNNIKIYMQCILDINNAYKYITFYEKDTTNQFLLLNQRIQFLYDAMSLIHKSNRNQLRYLRLQLAIAYSDLIDAKLEDTEAIPYLLYIQQRHKIIINVLLARAYLT